MQVLPTPDAPRMTTLASCFDAADAVKAAICLRSGEYRKVQLVFTTGLYAPSASLPSSCRIPVPAPLHAIATTLTVTPPFLGWWRRVDRARLPGSRGSNVSPRGPAPGRAGISRAALRTTVVNHVALYLVSTVFLLRSPSSPAAATMGCALSEHHTLTRRPTCVRSSTKFALWRGSGLESPQEAAVRCYAGLF